MFKITNSHDIAEILLKVALNTINQANHRSSDENKYLGHHLLFKLENQRSFNHQNYKGKNNYETNASSRAIEYTSGTIAETEK